MTSKDHSYYLDDESETVSLCDLLVHGDDSDHDTRAFEDPMKDNESFEFFTQEWVKNTKDFNFSPNKDTIFGGNLIIPNKPMSTNTQESKKHDHASSKVDQEWLKNDKDLNFFPHKDTIFGGNLINPNKPISRNTQEFKKHDLGSSKDDQDSGSCRNSEYAKLMSMNKGRSYGGKHETKRVFPASASMKSRWYYYGFGLAGIPTEMDMSAIKSRQNRSRKSHSGCMLGGGGTEESGGFRQGKRLSRLIRDLSCDGKTQANSMVKSSLVYIPRV